MDENSERGKPRDIGKKFKNQKNFEIKACLCFTSVRSLPLLLPIDTYPALMF